MDSHQPILFYHKNDPYYYLTNFHPSPFKVGSIVYPTNQHYFQSKKFQGLPYEKQIIQSQTPREAFDKAKKGLSLRREDWKDVKQKVMYEGLMQKFTQNSSLKVKLLETGDRKLVEHTQNDKYWADGGDGKGLNRLGTLLMKLREQLKKKQLE